MTEKDVFITRVYSHKGVEVAVNINLATKTMSLVEKSGGNGSTYVNKKWVFAERGSEYKAGWFNILEAMELAIGKAAEVLEEAQRVETENLAQMMMHLDQEKEKISKKGKK